MTILTLTDKGTLKMPREVIDHLRDTRHLQVRLNSHGVTLTPVRIQTAANAKNFPAEKGAKA